MKTQTILSLNAHNQDFYTKVGNAFDKTRQQAWPGWQLLLPDLQVLFQQVKKPNVLDLGCGNARFATFLTEQFPKNAFSYLGVDSNAYLLNQAKNKFSSTAQTMYDCTFSKFDIVEQLLFLDSNKASLFDHFSSYDLIVVFGVLHHIPSFKLRKKLCTFVGNTVTSHGLTVITLWNFETQNNHLLPAPANLKTTSDLEQGDFFLGWNNQPNVVRYCHKTTESELTLLQADANLENYRSFWADGRAATGNQYHLMKKKRTM